MRLRLLTLLLVFCGTELYAGKEYDDVYLKKGETYDGCQALVLSVPRESNCCEINSAALTVTSKETVEVGVLLTEPINRDQRSEFEFCLSLETQSNASVRLYDGNTDQDCEDDYTLLLSEIGGDP